MQAEYDIAPGFQRTPGTRKPRDDGPWYIQLRCGFYSTDVSYTTGQLRWIHEGHVGDIVAVKRA